MGFVRWEARPTLNRPVLVAAFEGWNDAGDAASTAAAYLARKLDAERFAAIDPEEFYDFTTTRPEVRLIDGLTRSIEWPANTFSAAITTSAAARDVVFLQGVEPQLRWRTFCSEVVDVARAVGVELVVTLGALLAEVPHTRPVRVTGTADNDVLATKLGLQRSRYEGPTGIVGVLHDEFRRAGTASASLWAAVPHYVGQTPSPKATLALVERAAELLELPLLTSDLDLASAAYERQVSEVVDADDDASAYVRSLEEAQDEDDDDEEPPPLSSSGADTLAAEVERYLRDHGQG
jgi:predicted ATP-grasp superfamily ATP-dependent carboligase